MSGILIDTNLLVYLTDAHDPVRQAQAQNILSKIIDARVGRIGAQNLAEFMSVALNKLRPPLPADAALEWVSRFVRIWPVYELTAQVVLEAGRGVRDYRLSYYDAQVWAVARLNQLTLVLSEDFQDGLLLEGVHFANPLLPGFSLDQWLS